MVIFISGTINSGKSTVAKILEGEIQNCANIDADALRNFVDWLDLEEAIPITIGNTISLVNNFVFKGYNVVVSYPLRKEDKDRIQSELSKLNTEIHFFTLSPNIEKCKSDSDNRKLSEWERKRIDYHKQTGLTKPDFGIIIDSTNHTPEETANTILNFVSSSNA